MALLAEKKVIETFYHGSYEHKIDSAKKALSEAKTLFSEGTQLKTIATFGKFLIVMENEETLWKVKIDQETNAATEKEKIEIPGLVKSEDINSYVMEQYETLVGDMLVGKKGSAKIESLLRMPQEQTILTMVEGAISKITRDGASRKFYDENKNEVHSKAWSEAENWRSKNNKTASVKEALERVDVLMQCTRENASILRDDKIVKMVNEDASTIRYWLSKLDTLKIKTENCTELFCQLTENLAIMDLLNIYAMLVCDKKERN